VATRRPCPTRCVVAILKAEEKGRNWVELLGRDWRDDWQAMLGGAQRRGHRHHREEHQRSRDGQTTRRRTEQDCNSEAHNSDAARIVMGPYLALLAAQAELRALLGGAGPSQGSGEGEEEKEDQGHAEAAEGAQGGGAPVEGAAGAGGGRRGSRKRAATDFLKPSGSKSNGAAEGARRGRGAECRGRNHFRWSVNTCRDESWLHDALASHGAPPRKRFRLSHRRRGPRRWLY
jgi:hypothetical protein